MHKTVSCALTIALTSHLLFYGGYGCLEKKMAGKKMIIFSAKCAAKLRMSLDGQLSLCQINVSLFFLTDFWS